MYYEYGEGISASGDDKWSKKLREDWENTDKIILSYDAYDIVQRKIKDIYIRKYKHMGYFGRFLNLFRNLFVKGKLRILFCRYFCPRMSCIGAIHKS